MADADEYYGLMHRSVCLEKPHSFTLYASFCFRPVTLRNDETLATGQCRLQLVEQNPVNSIETFDFQPEAD